MLEEYNTSIRRMLNRNLFDNTNLREYKPVERITMITRNCRHCGNNFKCAEPLEPYWEDTLPQFCPSCASTIVFEQPESWLHSPLVMLNGDKMYERQIYTTGVDVEDLPDTVKLEIANYIARTFKNADMLYPSYDCNIEERTVIRVVKSGDFLLAKNQNKPSIPKRISKHLFASTSLRMTPAMMEHIGNIVEQNSEQLQKWHLVQTRDLTLRRTHYGNEKSCWWTDQARSIQEFKRAGGFAVMGMETQDSTWPDNYAEHRVWVLPLNKKLKLDAPVDVINHPAYLFFNAYSSNAKINARQISAAFCNITGYKYKPVRINRCSLSMYINPTWHCLVYNENEFDSELIADIEELGI